MVMARPFSLSNMVLAWSFSMHVDLGLADIDMLFILSSLIWLKNFYHLQCSVKDFHHDVNVPKDFILLYTSFMIFLERPCMYENELEGIIFKNVIQLEIAGIKDCLTMLETALKHPAVWNQENSGPSEDSTMLIQFEVTKV